jgi:hypothetical protein
MKKIVTFLYISTLFFASCGEKKGEENTNHSQDTVNKADTSTQNLPPKIDSTRKTSVSVDSAAKNAPVAQKEEKKVEVKSTPKNAKNKVAKGVCPICLKKDRVIPVMYGRPGLELQEKEKKNEVKLAGCVYEKGMPRFHCKRDNKGFL